MAYDVQFTVDCADPHVLADWWAETLGWPVEPSDEAFIKDMIAKGYATEADTRIHRGTLVWSIGAAIRRPDDSGSTAGTRILFQRVPEPKTVKNRMHLDIRAGEDGIAAVQQRLAARGATVLQQVRQGPLSWVTMADPEGNEFCVT